jgi:formylglycine-generating enzyme required for sulfatase activity
MIDIGGRLYGLTPSIITDLLPGEYNLLLSKPGYTSIIKKFRIVDGQTTTIDLRLYKGREVTINTDPQGAEVFLGDSLIGITPFKILLDFGSHTVKVSKGTYMVVETITVTPTGQVSFNFKLKESNDPFGTQMILVKGGTFKMGDTSGDGTKVEKPVRNVTVRDFYISMYEITQAQWREIMGDNPSHFDGCDKCPVERVSWNEVQEFIKKLNLLTGKSYRLPTEAEWEYAARGGEKSRGLRYSGHNNINFVAWYTVNSGNKTQPVGQFTPNELGLYDMSGNVYEWCNDWMGDYPNIPEVDPKGPTSGDLRVVRGGSWFGHIAANRVSARAGDDPANGRSYIGFRLALNP